MNRLAVSVFGVLASCSAPPTAADPIAKTRTVETQTAETLAPTAAAPPPTPPLDDEVPRSDPVALLDWLVALGAQGGGATTMEPFPTSDWISTERVAVLLERMDSPRPAAHVVEPRCSMLPMQRTTEGVMARFVLDGMGAGTFPPRMSSEMFPPQDPESYREWWVRLQKLEVLALPTRADGAVDWERFRPAALLDQLQRHAGSAVRLPAYPPYGWVKRADIPDLLARARSDRPCATVVVHDLPPRAPPPTTQGATACMLLHLFREAAVHSHHAQLGSPESTEFERDPDAWDAWWRAFSR